MIGGFARRWFKEPKGHGPRVIIDSFRWHYDVSTDEEYEQALAKLNQGVSLSNFVECTPKDIKPQPVWNLLNPPRLLDLLHREDKKWELTTVECDKICSEIWASYRPFHNADRPAGIILGADGTASCAHALQCAVSKQGGTLTNRAAVVWAMLLLYLHEFVHQVVEDVVTALEFRTGEDLYRRAHAKWSGYILMEEALANSFARSLQSTVLVDSSSGKTYEEGRAHQARYDERPYTAEPEPIIDVSLMIGALDSVMRRQPPGYRDYQNFGPNIVRLFHDNLLTLVTLLYLPHRNVIYDKHVIIHYRHEVRQVIDAARLREGWSAWDHESIVHWR
jgi:hypothetical protein